MRVDVPAPDVLSGCRFWVNASFTRAKVAVYEHTVTGGSLVIQADQSPSARVVDMTFPTMDTDNIRIGDTMMLTCHAESTTVAYEWKAGSYVVSGVKSNSGALIVEAVLESQRVYDHYSANPRGVARASQIGMIIRNLLVEDDVFYQWDDSGTSPTVPHGFAIGTDRGRSLDDLLTAWGRVLVPAWAGGVRAVRIPAEPVASEPDIKLARGSKGTIIDDDIILDVRDVYNHVLVEVADRAVYGEAVEFDGPWGVNQQGYRSRIVEGVTASSLVVAEATAMSELQRQKLRTVTTPVEMIPDWRIELFDPVAVETSNGWRWRHVTGVEIPLSFEGTAVIDCGGDY